MTMSYDDAGSSGVQRFEVFTGAGRRREWPAEVKASIVAESYSGQETVCAVARRHGLAPSQLFTWRRKLRREIEEQGDDVSSAAQPARSFVPALVEPVPSGAAASTSGRSCRRRRAGTGAIELEIGGATIRIANGADAATVTAVIEALRVER